jgi:hypothetical protein
MTIGTTLSYQMGHRYLGLLTYSRAAAPSSILAPTRLPLLSTALRRLPHAR